jgi:hypothetical protein
MAMEITDDETQALAKQSADLADLTWEAALLLQKRYNIISDIRNCTDELLEASHRGDQISIDLLIGIREEEILKCEEKLEMRFNQLVLSDTPGEHYLREMIFADPESMHPGNGIENKLLELRRHIQSLVNEVKTKDRCLSRNIAKERSFYHK